MLFRQLFARDTCTYTYLIADIKTKEAVLVDSVLEQVERDFKLLNELGLELKYCWETHIHADHITGTGKLRKMTGCEGIVPDNAQAACANRYIKDGEILKVGSLEIKAIETHGHTDSHMAYLVNNTHVFTGDALFIRGCGRTDFQSGDAGTLYLTFISPTDEIHLKSLGKRDGIKKKNEYEFNGVRIKGISVSVIISVPSFS